MRTMNGLFVILMATLLSACELTLADTGAVPTLGLNAPSPHNGLNAPCS